MRRVLKDCWKSVRRVGRKIAQLFGGPRQLGNPDGHYLKQRYGLDEKPPGWNDEVLDYFHGPEEGRPGRESSAFDQAFRERASSPGLAARPPRRCHCTDPGDYTTVCKCLSAVRANDDYLAGIPRYQSTQKAGLSIR